MASVPVLQGPACAPNLFLFRNSLLAHMLATLASLGRHARKVGQFVSLYGDRPVSRNASSRSIVVGLTAYSGL